MFVSRMVSMRTTRLKILEVFALEDSRAIKGCVKFLDTAWVGHWYVGHRHPKSIQALGDLGARMA
jgi:hypothetical protein